MLFTTFCTSNFIAAAAELGDEDPSGQCGDSVTWTLDVLGCLYISGSGDMWDYEDASARPWNAYAEEIRNVFVGAEVTRIGNYAFASCPNLTSVYLEGVDKTIGSYAFYNCAALYDVVGTESIEKIMEGAFSECTSFTSFTIGPYVTYIGDKAFAGDTGMRTVSFMSNEDLGSFVIGDNVFQGCTLLSKFDVEKSHIYLEADGEALYSIVDGTYIKYPSHSFSSSCTVPSGITTIKEGAFEDAEYLEELELPEGLITLEDNSICGISYLQELIIPASVQSMGSNIGKDCYSLEVIENKSDVSMTLPVLEGIKWADDNGNLLSAIKSGKAYARGIVTKIELPEEKECMESETFYFPESYEYANSKITPRVEDLVFYSSNPSVATIDESGCVEAIAAGTTVITVSSRYGSTSASCKLTVVGNYVIQNDADGIPDKNFYDYALEIADLDGDGILTVAEADRIIGIRASNLNIKDITGIHYFKNAEIVCFSNYTDEFNCIEERTADGWNEISDISELASLENLKELHMENNEISDISALEGLLNLNFVYLNGNNISAIRPLAKLEHIWELRACDNNICDISAVTGWKEMYRLEIDNNQILDISAVENLTELALFTASGNQISDVSPLASCGNLVQINLSNNQIADISSLADTGITHMELANNQISDISALEGMSILYFDVCDNQVSDIGVVETWSFVEKLYIANNPITDLSPLQKDNDVYGVLPFLELDLSGLNISDISFLEDHTELEKLYLSHNCIKDIRIFAEIEFDALRVLDLSYNQIEDISPVENMTDLEELYLEGNPATEKNGVYEGEDGYLYYFKDGEIDESFTSLAQYEGVWYYFEAGVLNRDYTGLVYYYGSWYYVEAGILNWNYTGLTYYYGTWYYVEGGILNWNYTGLTYYYGTWYYVESGILNWGFTGLVYHYGTWYYVEGGVLNWNYTGIVYQYGIWWYVENGILVGAA